MGKEIIDLLVDGGKAVAGPQIGQKLGPAGINIADVLKKINEKTALFTGMKVPVKLQIDTSTKEVNLKIGTPPVSELIKGELGLEKGSGSPSTDKLGNLAIEQVIKLARMKRESMLANTLKGAVKNVVGSCGSMGILVEGKEPKVIEEEIERGLFDEAIQSESTKISDEKKRVMIEQLETVRERIKREQEKAKAAAIATEVTGEVKTGAEEKETETLKPSKGSLGRKQSKDSAAQQADASLRKTGPASFSEKEGAESAGKKNKKALKR